MPAVQKADRPAGAPVATPASGAPLALVAGSEVVAARWTYVCAVADILPNTGVCAKVGDEQVAVFRVMSPSGEEEGVFAIANLDPRADANVLSRGLVGDVDGQLVVASPVYKNHFCLKTGACLEDPAYDVGTYGVRIADGRVFVRGSAQ